MRKSLAFLVALVAFALLTETAAAGQVKLQGTYSRSQMGALCKAAGGTDYGTTAMSGGFGCVGEKGVVECNSAGSCTGTCDACGARLVGSSKMGRVLNVLNNQRALRVRF